YQSTAQGEHAGRMLACDGQERDRNAVMRGFGGDARLGWAVEHDLVAALAQSGRFGEDADLLAAPAAGRFGVRDAQRAALNVGLAHVATGAATSAGAVANWMRCSFA